MNILNHEKENLGEIKKKRKNQLNISTKRNLGEIEKENI